MQKYPYKLSIAHPINGIVNPLEVLIVSVHTNPRRILHDIILTAAEQVSAGVLLEVIGAKDLTEWFISSDLLLKGIVQVVPAELSEEELTLFNKCVNTN